MGCLFFLQAHAIALWFVPFSSVLKAYGLAHITPWAFASGAFASFVSPMVMGALADQHASAKLILRALSLGMAVLLALTFWAIENHWNAFVVLAFVQLLQLCFAPCWGITTMLVLGQLSDPSREFGIIRVWGTFGWMSAGFAVSLLLQSDGSTVCGFAAAIAWVGVALLTVALPDVVHPKTRSPMTWRTLLGWETFSILRVPQHRALFLSAGLLSVPLAAFYPYTPLHLQDLGIQKTSAFMALGQLLEAASMLAMAPLLRRFNLRSIFVFAIAVACLRYLIFFSNTLPGLVIGILLHGICFTLFFIPAQIYVEQHIPKDLRFRAQALMTLLISGFGNLLGFLGCGALYRFCTIAHEMQWSLYWLVLAVMVALVGGYFLRAYRSASERSDPFVLEKSSVI